MSIPETLAERLEMYRETGQLTHCDHETFVETNWIAVLVGQNFLPNTYNRRADNISDEQLDSLMGKIHRTLQRVCDASPSHEEFLRQYCS